MDAMHAVDFSLGELRDVVRGLDDSEMDHGTNCDPWTVRRLASHALNNQLFWGGLVAGQALPSFEDTMGAAPIEGDLGPVADDVATRAAAMWRTDGILEALHETPLGTVPGSVVIQFALIDALAHAWDLSVSVGRPFEFDAAELPWITDVVAATCTQAARDHDLIKDPTDPPADATSTERLMALAGRTVPRP